MKKLLSISVLALAAAAAPAQGATDTSLTVTVDASLAQSCAFNAANSDLSYTLSNTQRNDSGAIAYSCNYIGTPVVTITSANGGLKPAADATANGASTLAYQIVFGDSATSTNGNVGLFASQFTSGVSSTSDQNGWTSTLAANTERTPLLSLYLTNPIEIAGSYSDTLTIAIAP